MYITGILSFLSKSGFGSGGQSFGNSGGFGQSGGGGFGSSKGGGFGSSRGRFGHGDSEQNGFDDNGDQMKEICKGGFGH